MSRAFIQQNLLTPRDQTPEEMERFFEEDLEEVMRDGIPDGFEEVEEYEGSFDFGEGDEDGSGSLLRVPV